MPAGRERKAGPRPIGSEISGNFERVDGRATTCLWARTVTVVETKALSRAEFRTRRRRPGQSNPPAWSWVPHRSQPTKAQSTKSPTFGLSVTSGSLGLSPSANGTPCRQPISSRSSSSKYSRLFPSSARCHGWDPKGLWHLRGILRLRQQASGLGDNPAAARPPLAIAYRVPARPSWPADPRERSEAISI